MSNNLTNQETWNEYWSNYRFQSIPQNPVYRKYIPELKEKSSFIEIGGFPGLNAGYFFKHVCKDVSILDFHIDRTVIRQMEEYNGITPDTIQCIDTDFFSFQPQRNYDIVFSLGFIEHFRDTKDVIQKHYMLLNNGGKLLIILPNLRGINGAIQYLFDRKNLEIHNLGCMDISFLKDICKELGLKNITVEYTRKPMVWLEPKPTFLNKTGRVLTKLLSYALKLIPVKCRLLSPYIVILGEK